MVQVYLESPHPLIVVLSVRQQRTWVPCQRGRNWRELLDRVPASAGQDRLPALRARPDQLGQAWFHDHDDGLAAAGTGMPWKTSGSPASDRSSSAEGPAPAHMPAHATAVASGGATRYRGLVVPMRLVHGVLVATLGVTPAAAVACSVFCVGQAGAHGPAHESPGHTHHDGPAHHDDHAAAALTDREIGDRGHACDRHDRIVSAAATLERPAPATPDTTAWAPVPAACAATLDPDPSVVRAGFAHAPPGRQADTTILRI